MAFLQHFCGKLATVKTAQTISAEPNHGNNPPTGPELDKSPGRAVSHPDFPAGAARYEVTPRPKTDEAATAQTVAAMYRLMRADATRPVVLRAATEATRGAAGQAKEAAAIWRWVKSRVRFREDAEAARPLAGLIDPDQAEVLIRPADLLTMPSPAGDCDCHAMLNGALLLSRGIEPELVTIAADPDYPDTYSHVYARARLAGGPLAMDTSHGQAPGWEAPAAGKSRTWRTTEMSALGAIDWSKLLTTGVEATAKIATARYGQPPVGTYSQSAAGDIFYRQPANSSPLQFPGVQIGAGGGYVWILAAAGVLGLIMLMNARRN